MELEKISCCNGGLHGVLLPRGQNKKMPMWRHSPGKAACPYVGKLIDSCSQGGDKACKGGERVHRHFEGGGGKSNLLPGSKKL